MPRKPVISPPLEDASARQRGGHRPSGLTREQKEAAVMEFEARKIKEGSKGVALEIAAKLGVTATALYWWRKQMQQGWKNSDPYKAERKKGNGKALVPVKEKSIVAIATPDHLAAILYLRKGKQELLEAIKDGETELSNTTLMAMLALNALQPKK